MNIHNLPKYGYEGATRDDWDTYDIGWFITLDLIGLTTIGEIGGVSKLLPPCIVCGIKRECFTVKGTANRNYNTTRKNHYERLSIIIPIFLKQFCPQNTFRCSSVLKLFQSLITHIIQAILNIPLGNIYVIIRSQHSVKQIKNTFPYKTT